MVHYFTRKSGIGLLCLLAVAILLSSAATDAFALTAKQKLGKLLYFDVKLSNPVGQSCASCHDPATGFAEPDAVNPVSEGVVLGRFGNRNAPSAAYAAFSPRFKFDAGAGLYMGGQFWDGRATSLAAQARGPFLNPVEMNATVPYVVNQVRKAKYATLFLQVFGPTSLDQTSKAYVLISQAIAAYEASKELNKFNSKYDQFLLGQVALTAQEQEGLNLFEGKAKCDKCHVTTPGPGGTPPILTDFTYDNLGIPSNPVVLQLINDPNFVDKGLGVSPALPAPDPAQDGKFKVPTLRNIAKTGPYGHNGFFQTLDEIVHFYNTRDVPGAGWPAPEVPVNVNTVELGDLGLTLQEEQAIVAFMNTLTDQ